VNNETSPAAYRYCAKIVKLDALKSLWVRVGELLRVGGRMAAS
jgi:hypothetical protein